MVRARRFQTGASVLRMAGKSDPVMAGQNIAAVVTPASSRHSRAAKPALSKAKGWRRYGLAEADSQLSRNLQV
jgi:hypothetical protein